MLSIGYLDFPFLRRMGVTMQFLGIEYQHRGWRIAHVQRSCPHLWPVRCPVGNHSGFIEPNAGQESALEPVLMEHRGNTNEIR